MQPTQRTWIALSFALAACAGDPEPAQETSSAPAPRQEEAPPPERPELPFEMLEGEPMYTVLPKDAIPSVNDPHFLLADEADAVMDPDEPVMGVVGINGTAKAYSAWQLDGHEIVNDVLDGQPITATW